MILIRKSVEFYKKGSKTDALYEYMQYRDMPLPCYRMKMQRNNI